MRRFLYDTSIFIYALGRDHHYKEPCREIVRRATVGELQGEACADLLQELAHQQARRTGNRPRAAKATRNVAKLAWWHPVEPNDVHRGLGLFEAHTNLDARDAVFAAVALNRGIDAILATDRAFDEIGALERLDPVDEPAVATLVADARRRGSTRSTAIMPG
jgi:predicted nucleic acid-binding protein